MLALAAVLGSIPNRPGTKLRLQHQALGFVYTLHDDLLTVGFAAHYTQLNLCCLVTLTVQYRKNTGVPVLLIR